MDFKIVDDVNISKEELDYYENHDFGEEIRKGLEDGTAIVSEGPWEETVKAVQAKLSANACSKPPTYIPFSGCRPAFSISPASRRTSSFSISVLRARIRRPKRFGFTTCAPICTLPSKRIP